MMCRSCSSEAYSIRTVVQEGTFVDFCDRCSDVRIEGVPDVYLGHVGQKFANLCDDMGRPYEISSKRQKKEVMDRLGVSEAGDRVNGAPYGSKTWIEGTREFRRKQFDKERPMIRETLRRWKEKR